MSNMTYAEAYNLLVNSGTAIELISTEDLKEIAKVIYKEGFDRGLDFARAACFAMKKEEDDV